MKVLRMTFAALAAVATALVVLPAAPASANVPTNPADIQLVTVRVEGTTGSLASGSVPCPPGTTGVGVGVRGSADIVSTSAFWNNDGFAAEGRITGASTSASFELTASCASTSLVTDVFSVRATRHNATRPIGSHTYTCPNGGFAFAGTGQGDGLLESRMMINMPTADGHGWTVSGTASGREVSIDLRCFNAAASGLRAWVEEESVRWDAEEMVTTAGNCAGGITLAGGVGILNADGSPAANGNLRTSRWDGQKWQGAGRLPGHTVSNRLLVRAVCVARL